MIKTAIINAKTGAIEYKELDTINPPLLITEKSDNEKLITYAKTQGWI